jgi:hypothetical protein
MFLKVTFWVNILSYVSVHTVYMKLSEAHCVSEKSKAVQELKIAFQRSNAFFSPNVAMSSAVSSCVLAQFMTFFGLRNRFPKQKKLFEHLILLHLLIKCIFSFKCQMVR